MSKRPDQNPAVPESPGERSPSDWLPPMPDLSEPPPQPFFQRTTRRIKPIHLWAGSLGSALIGGMLVLGVILYLGRRSATPPPPGDGDGSPAVVAPSGASPGASDAHRRPATARTHGDPDRSRHERVAAEKAKQADALTKEDVIAVVQQNASGLGACIDAARSRDKVPSGPVTLLLDFTVAPNGAVKAVDLKGPDWVRRTSLPKCFGAKIRAWRFPASRAGAPIKNLPLPVTF